jgi:hypothetical protein
MRTRLITVSAINILTMVNDHVLKNRRRGFAAELELPSLRERARLITAENSVLPLIEEEDAPTIAIMRE